MKLSAILAFGLCSAVFLSTAHSQEGAVEPAPPEASIGALTYDEFFALYSYLDYKDTDGSGNGVSINTRFSNRQNFFSEVGLNWFGTEGNDIITLSGGIGSWLPITDNFHIVGSGGLGLVNVSSDQGGDSTNVNLQGQVLARWLVFGFLELNGGYIGGYDIESETDFHGAVYGASVNVSKTWQLILRARLDNDAYDEYGVGVRYRW